MPLQTTKIKSEVRRVIAQGRDEYLSDGQNLYLRVRASGAASWVVRKKHGTRIVVTTLGQWKDGHGMTLAEAREKSRSLDPKAAAHGLTLGTFLREWYREQVLGRYRRPHHVDGYLERLEADEAALWNTKLRDLEHLLVFQALKRYAKRRGPIAANRLTSIIKTALRYATQAGYLSASPVAGITADIIGGADRARARVLTDDEISKMWHTEAAHTPLLRFLLLTGQRIGEAQLATWEHIKDDTWTIPASHAKNARAHWVPIPPAAQAILDTQDKTRRRVFGITSNTAAQAWLKRWCAREKIEPAFTPHDLRRTFTTRLNDLGIAPHVVEKMLNHTMQGVMGVYNRAEYADERRDAAKKWADAVQAIVGRQL